MPIVPQDVRAARDFRVIKGIDQVLRTDYTIDSTCTSLKQGEWFVLNSSNKAIKATGFTKAAPAVNALVNWTVYVQGDTSNGQSDVVATNHVTAISGPYQAETKFYETTGTFTPGFLLVVRESSTVANQGVLDAVDPAAATALQVAAHIGIVVSFSGGILTYRTTGQA